MRILHVTFMYPVPEKPVHGVSVQDIVHGIKTYMPGAQQVVLHISNELPEVLHGELQANDVLYYRVKMPVFYKIFHFYSSAKIEKIFTGLVFDLVHFHNFFPGVFLFSGYILKRNTPYIITFQGSCSRALRFSYRKDTLRKMLEGASAYIFLSDYYYNEITSVLKKKNISLASNITYFIPPFKDESWKAGVKRNDISKPVKIIIIANIETRKNIVNTLKGVKLLQRYYYIHCNIYGYIYDDDLFMEVKKYLDENNRYFPPLQNDELKSVIDEHHILLLCAHKETFGMAYIEAILRERPIVYSQKAGIAGFIRNYNYGAGVEDVNDPQEISNAIEYCIENYNSFNFEGKDRFTESNVIPEIVHLYMNAVRRK